MGLLKQIHTELEQNIVAQQAQLEAFQEKMKFISEGCYSTDLLETAQEFLTHTAEIIKSGKPVDAARAKELAAKLTAIELIGDPGTRGAAFSKIVGDDSQYKLSKIIQHATNSVDLTNKVDAILVQIANRIGKSGVSTNTETLSSLDKMDEKTRNTKAAQLVALASKFQQIEAKLKAASTQDVAKTSSPGSEMATA